jgi:cytochrome c biogenesis protein
MNIPIRLWRFFASVQLALATLFILAATSITGTVIEQGKAPEHYIQEYGQTMASFLQFLDIPKMYSSWWFVGLLTLFAINLIVCSIERLPSAWRLMTADHLAVDLPRLEKMSSVQRLETDLPAGTAADRIRELLGGAGWKSPAGVDREGSILLFAQQGAWTRLGVYIVHLSILVIMAGAVLGSWFGYKAYVFLPEGRATTQVFLQGKGEPVPLGFELYYDQFEQTHYPNGKIREYRSDLTVYDAERDTPYQKSSVVNDPLNYRGVSFYLADNQPLEEYFVVVGNRSTGEEQAFRMPPQRSVEWSGITFAIEEIERDQEGAARRAKISFSGAAGAEPSTLWMGNKSSVNFVASGQEFTLSFRQLYSTLFLATKDPGVWMVYFGFFLIVAGLCISFGFSHQRLWVCVTPGKKQGARLLVSGVSNKHQPAFERRFQDLVARMQQDLPMNNIRPLPAELRRPPCKVKKAV